LQGCSSDIYFLIWVQIVTGFSSILATDYSHMYFKNKGGNLNFTKTEHFSPIFFTLTIVGWGKHGVRKIWESLESSPWITSCIIGEISLSPHTTSYEKYNSMLHASLSCIN